MDKSVSDFNVRLRTIRIRDLIIGLIICIVLMTAIVAAFPVFDEDDIFIALFFFIALLLFAWALRGTAGIERNLEKLSDKGIQKEILYVLVINLLFAYLFLFAISAIDVLNGLFDPAWVTMSDIDTVNLTSDMIIINAIGSVILAPVVEELAFRGVLFNRLKIRAGIIPAMIISSLIFAVGHDFGGMTSAFLFGICMCILYLKTDNILIPMSVHFLNNLFATFVEVTGADTFLTQFPWIFPALAISIVGTVLLFKYIIQESRILKKEYS